MGNEISKCMYGKTSPQPCNVETEDSYQNACADKCMGQRTFVPNTIPVSFAVFIYSYRILVSQGVTQLGNCRISNALIKSAFPAARPQMIRLLCLLVFIKTKILEDSTGNLSTDELATRFLDKTESPPWSWNKSWTEINSWQAFSDWSSNVPHRGHHLWNSHSLGTAELIHVVSITPNENGEIDGNQVMPRHEMVILGGARAIVAPHLLIYSPDINAWRIVKTRHNPPPRYSATVVTICSKYVILIGGKKRIQSVA